MSISELSEQEQIRRNSLAELRKLGIEPYPAAKYEVTATAARIAAEYDPDKGNFQEVSIAGRIMSRRIMGSASFFELQDHTGRIQVYVKRDDICNGDPESTLYNKVFKKLLDIGDIVGIRGFAFMTKTGELSVHCKELTVLSKSLRPLPVVKEQDGTLVRERHEAGDARLARTLRGDDAAKINRVSHVSRITETLLPRYKEPRGTRVPRGFETEAVSGSRGAPSTCGSAGSTSPIRDDPACYDGSSW